MFGYFFFQLEMELMVSPVASGLLEMETCLGWQTGRLCQRTSVSCHRPLSKQNEVRKESVRLEKPSEVIWASRPAPTTITH